MTEYHRTLHFGCITMFEHFFAHNTPELLSAIDRAVNKVEPRLKQDSSYPDAYRLPVINALNYTRKLAHSVPGPVAIDHDAYATNAYVHAIFPSTESFSEAIKTSIAMQDYLRDHATGDAVYALMGMRLCEKTTLGMALSGEVIQQDTRQEIVYFIHHTLENPASSEQETREQLAWRFFDSLVNKVAKRAELRKQGLQDKRQQIASLMDALRVADARSRPPLEESLSAMLSGSPAAAMALSHYAEDFTAVLLNPEQYLRLTPRSISLDNMGIKHDKDDAGKMLTFDELTGFDHRDWTVNIVQCRDIHSESFTARLETAYRMLCI